MSYDYLYLYIIMLFEANNIPLHNIFVMILIISANWMMVLYPCRFRTLITNNIFVRHIFGFFTMLFFVVLTNSEDTLNLNSSLIDSVYLYTLFIMLIRTPIFIFITILILLCILYVLNIKKKEVKEDKSLDDDASEKKLDNISNIKNVISSITYILLFLGFIVYLGQKKLEYKSEFSYITFLFGKNDCINTSPETSYIKGIMHVFD